MLVRAPLATRFTYAVSDSVRSCCCLWSIALLLPNSIADFLAKNEDEIPQTIAQAIPFPTESTQRDAWIEQIRILRPVVQPPQWAKHLFQYAVPRLGKTDRCCFAYRPRHLRCRVQGAKKEFTASAIDQVVDYAVDLKNFHETTHERTVAPYCWRPRPRLRYRRLRTTAQNDGVYFRSVQQLALTYQTSCAMYCCSQAATQ